MSWQDGAFQYLGTLPGGTWSSANAINRKGHVAMTATRMRYDAVIVWRPALYNGQRIVELGVLENSTQAEARALNNHDDVVSHYYWRPTRTWKAFLFTGGRVYALESLVENLEGRALGSPAAIAHDGTIVGAWWTANAGRGYRLERVETPARR